MDLDFEEIPQSGNSTAKWFQEHPDINAGKILDGLLGIKNEFPDDSSNPGSTGTGSSAASTEGLQKPTDTGGIGKSNFKSITSPLDGCHIKSSQFCVFSSP